MILIPEHFKPKHAGSPGGGSNHSPASVTQFWNIKKARVPLALRPIAASKRVAFQSTVKVREFNVSPPLSPSEERQLWYSKKEFAIFNAENRVLTKAIRCNSRTGDKQVRPEVPELRGLEDHLSIRAHLEAKGRHNRALTAVFIEQQRQKENQRTDAEAIRAASVKVTRQSLDIALYRGKMDHQRCMMPSAARIGFHKPVTRKSVNNKPESGEIVKPSQRQGIHRPDAIAQPIEAAELNQAEVLARQRPGRPLSHSSLRFREASMTKDKSPSQPKRRYVQLQSPRKPEIECPSSFAIGKPRRGRVVEKP